MKATVMEIHKNYCIVMTRDGQFLKHKTAAGSVEIGDEIVISKAVEVRLGRLYARGFAIAAAVVVVVVGGVFSYRYLNKFYPVGGVRELAEAEVEDKEVYQEAEAPAEAEVTQDVEEEAATVAAEFEESAVDEIDEAGGLMYEKDFVVEEGIEVEEFIIDDLRFKYRIYESDGEKQILISFINTSASLSFTGSADIILLSGDNILKELHIDLVDLGPWEEKEETVVYEEDASILRVRMNGGFN
ncbi:MAG: anti-sigma factor domain-containing protein [Actinobacteria bacterium]|nr:anti-sigma factor domain-containing protein [Actinomycetota bacterium]